jgi:hypothetical protein
MLNLKRIPDPIIEEILTRSFDMALTNIRAKDGIEWFKEKYPNIVSIFTYETALKGLQNLSFYHQCPGVYGFNDFHLVIIYDALYLYCEHNNAKSVKNSPLIKGTKIVEIDLEGLLNQFFPNTDFCPCCLVKKEGKPTLEKLENRLLEEDEYLLWEDKNNVPIYNSTSTKYPDPQHSVEERNYHA